MAAPPGPVAIIAGGGGFPLEIAEAARSAGRDVSIVALRGFAARGLKRYPVVWADMLDPARILETLRGVAPAAVVLAGSVTRPGPGAITSIFSAYRNREHIAKVLSGGDDRILRGVVQFIEEAGFHVVGAHEIAPALLAPEGAFAGRQPTPAERDDIARAVALLAATGPFDVGQGAVVCAGQVLALEGPEGTDAMLERVAGLVRRKRVTIDGAAAVLAKLPKPGQDTRVDLPAIGPRTIDRAKAARVSAIAVAAGGVVVIERSVTVAAARDAGIALVGIAAAGAGA